MKEKCSKFYFGLRSIICQSLETKIQVVSLMAKCKSPVIVICELRRRGTANIPERRTVTSIYHKFVETGSFGHRAHAGRASTRKSLIHVFVEDETIYRQNYLQMLKNYFYLIMQKKDLIIR